MRIALFINGSPRKNGNTAQLLRLPVSGPSRFYGANGVSRSQLLRLLQASRVEIDMFMYR